MAVMLTDGAEQSRTREKRYMDFIKISMVGLDQNQRLQVALIIKKGELDASNTTERRSSLIKGCSQNCSTSMPDAEWSNCTIACYEKEDQTLANIVRCNSQPDKLPF